MIRWLILLLVIPPAFAREVDPYEVTCGRNALARLEKGTTFVGHMVEKVVGDRLDMIHTKTERQFLLNHPGGAEFVRRTACRAISLSIVGCDVDASWFLDRMGDEESDAVRHFVFSALLACGRGKDFAERFTIAHEGDGDWDEGNRMDIRNNYAGFAWADPAAGNCASPNVERRAVREALLQLESKKLVTLKRGETACREPKEALASLEGPARDEFLDRVKDVGLNLRDVLPGRCD